MHAAGISVQSDVTPDMWLGLWYHTVKSLYCTEIFVQIDIVTPRPETC